MGTTPTTLLQKLSKLLHRVVNNRQQLIWWLLLLPRSHFKNIFSSAFPCSFLQAMCSFNCILSTANIFLLLDSFVDISRVDCVERNFKIYRQLVASILRCNGFSINFSNRPLNDLIQRTLSTRLVTRSVCLQSSDVFTPWRNKNLFWISQHLSSRDRNLFEPLEPRDP